MEHRLFLLVVRCFEVKIDNFKAGTQFDVKKVVKYGHTSRIQLGNGMYISGNKLINKFVK